MESFQYKKCAGERERESLERDIVIQKQEFAVFNRRCDWLIHD